jgi:hypothetical protein
MKKVDLERWREVREQTRRSFEELRDAIREHSLDSSDSLAASIGAVAHVAYHLGAIRSHLASERR